jgi:hypothetical protein
MSERKTNIIITVLVLSRFSLLSVMSLTGPHGRHANHRGVRSRYLGTGFIVHTKQWHVETVTNALWTGIPIHHNTPRARNIPPQHSAGGVLRFSRGSVPHTRGATSSRWPGRRPVRRRDLVEFGPCRRSETSRAGAWWRRNALGSVAASRGRGTEGTGRFRVGGPSAVDVLA